MFKFRSVRVSLLALAILALPGALTLRLFPLQVRDAVDSMRAWRMGLMPIRSANGLSGWQWGLESGAGSGRTCVVLVHGIGDEVATWHRLMAKAQGPQGWAVGLPEPVRVLAWDLPGHGRSYRPRATVEGTAELRPMNMAQRLWEATQKAGCTGRSVWVGNSLGGWISSWVALRHPESVRGLVLLDPAGLLSQARHPATPSLEGLVETPTVESLREFRKRGYAHPDYLNYPDWVWQAAVERLQSMSVRRTRNSFTVEDTLDAHLGQVAVPTVVLWGKQDRILPLEASQDFRRLAPATISSFRELDDCGHQPQKEAIDAVVTAIRDVLRFGSF